MSEKNEPLELLTSAQAALRQVKQVLRAPAPASLTECGAPLETVAGALRQLGVLTKTDAERVAPMVREIQRELSDVQQLLEQAGACYLVRFRLLESATGAYDASGELSAPAGNALSVRG